MKQKIVMKVSMNGSKSRTKAMRIAVSVPGVTSVQLDGVDKNNIVVTGEGIDSTNLTVQIRKRVGFTELISVTPITEGKKEEKKDVKKEPAVKPVDWNSLAHQYGTPQQAFWHGTPQQVYVHYQDDQDNCTIM